MKAVMAYDYARDKWILIHLSVITMANDRDSAYFKMILSDEGHYLYPEWADVELVDYKFLDDWHSYSFDDSNLPEVVTLEQSIQNNIKLLSSWTT